MKIASLFLKIYDRIARHKVWSLLILLCITAGLAVMALSITFEEDITKLIPADEKAKEFQKVLKTVKFTDKIIVNLQKDDNGTSADLVSYASNFIDSLQPLQDEFIEDIQGQVKDDAIEGTLQFIYDNLPLFLTPEDYNEIKRKLPKDSIAKNTEANYKTLISPSGVVAKKTILKDPLGLSFIGLKKLQDLGIGDQFTLKDGFILSKDEQNLLLFITPKFETGETNKNTPFAEALYRIQNNLNVTYDGKTHAEYFGGALVAVANAKQIKGDIQITVTIAMTILMVIFIVFYRKISIPVILFVPTIFGGLLSVAFLFLVRTHISAISLGIGSVLLGVTLDYSLHILTHLRNNTDIKELYNDVAKPILMSSLTTAMAFLCLLFVNSQALQDLGLFAAVSVLGASVFALIFIPQVYKGSKKTIKKSTLLDRLAAYNFHKNKWIIGGLLLLVVVSMFTYNKVIFNQDISKLNYEPEFLEDARNRLDALTQLNSKSVYIATFGEDKDTVLQQNDSIFKTLSKLKANQEILNFTNVGALVQSKVYQQNRIDNWNQFWTEQRKDSLQNNYIESGAQLGFKPETFNQFYTLLDKDFQPIKDDAFEAINSIKVSDYISTKEDFTTITTLVKVDDGQEETLDQAFENTQNTVLINRQKLNETLLGNLKNDFNKLIGYSLIVVVVLLLLFYKSLSLTIVTGLPIFLSWLLTVGLMGLLGIQFNIFNIIISTFIFGLGVDYCIFVTNGLLKEYRTGEETLNTHKTSIVLSVITTILGIGVLIFAKHPALYTISVVCMIGIFSAMLVAFTIQPLLFNLFIGSPTKRPTTFRYFIHGVLSFGYFGLGGLLLSFLSVTVMKILPFSREKKMKVFHQTISKFMKSVLYTNGFVKKQVINEGNEDFKTPGIVIANHTSFLDILAVGMLHPKMIFLVSDWVYNSPVFGKAVQLAGFYPVSNGIDNGVDHLKKKVDEGYSLMAFPEGTRSTTNKIRRFHKGAIFLAEELNLDIIPVLIHGNSEVLPKGSFVIKDGSISVKILDRIPVESEKFGTTLAKKTKAISTLYRKEFQKFRDSIEGPKYFHKVLLEDYRYKGDALYNSVKRDIKTHAQLYYDVRSKIDQKAKIVSISKEFGQLELLLALDGPERKITSFVEDEKTREILQHTYITNSERKIEFTNTSEHALNTEADTLLLNTNEIQQSTDIECFKIVIVLKNTKAVSEVMLTELGYKNSHRQENLSIFKKIE